MGNLKTEGEFTSYLPQDWFVGKLGNFGSFSKGKGITKKELVEIGISCIRYGEIYTTESYVINQFTSFIDEVKGTKLKEGDVLFAGSGETIEEIGKAVTFIGDEDAYAGGDIVIFSPNSKQCNSVFLVHLLETSNVKKQKRRIGQGNSVVHIYSRDLANLNIYLPSLVEQQIIADFLMKWDNVFQTLQTIIDQKQLQKKWLMQQLLTGKKRLPGFEGAWEEHKLVDYFKERKETKCVGLSLLSVGEAGVYPQTKSNKKDTSNSDKSKYKRICKGDIGYNTMRMWQGRSALSSLEGIISPAYTVVTPREHADGQYFAYLFKTPELINKFYRKSQGLVSDTLNCKFKDFAIVKTELPSTIQEQKAIAEVLTKADEEIKLLEQKLMELKEQKKGLMQQLLTGKKRLV